MPLPLSRVSRFVVDPDRTGPADRPVTLSAPVDRTADAYGKAAPPRHGNGTR